MTYSLKTKNKATHAILLLSKNIDVSMDLVWQISHTKEMFLI